MRTKLTLVFAAIAFVTVALLVRSWLDAREAAVHLAATLDAQKQVISAAGAREQQRDAQLQQALAHIAALKRAVQTPAQAVAALPGALPPLPAPLDIEIPSAPPPSGSAAPEQATTVKNPSSPANHQLATGDSSGAGNSPASSTSAPPALFTIPQQDLKPLYDYLQDCRACQAQLTVARADLADEKTKSQALARERDAAVRAAKGGGFWARAKRAAKWFAIGAGAGVAFTCASGHCR